MCGTRFPCVWTAQYKTSSSVPRNIRHHVICSIIIIDIYTAYICLTASTAWLSGIQSTQLGTTRLSGIHAQRHSLQKILVSLSLSYSVSISPPRALIRETCCMKSSSCGNTLQYDSCTHPRFMHTSYDTPNTPEYESYTPNTNPTEMRTLQSCT